MILSSSQLRRFARGRRLNFYQPRIETMECRIVPTTTLFLDFGGGIGMGNTLNETVGNFRDIFGNNTGTNMTNGTTAFPGGLAAGDSLDFSPLNYDFDLNGFINNADITALANAVVPLVQRALEPFDIDIVVGTATSFADAVNSVNANSGDASGEFDAYVFVTAITSDGFTSGTNVVGNQFSLFGRAATPDLGSQTGNNTDEGALTFADTIFGSAVGTPLTAAFNASLAQRLAYTATHEAFHTFSYVHTPDEANSNPPASANQRLLASGDVIRLGSNTRDNPFIVTRFDLLHLGAAVPEPNNYLLAANDSDIGLRDDNSNGVPNLAYSTGTGAHDQLVFTNLGGGIVDVDVNAYSNTARTSLIAAEIYNIALGIDTEGEILVDASINNDEVVVDATIATPFRIRAGQGVDGVGTEADLLTLQSGGLSGTYTPGGPGAGFVSYAGGAQITFSEFEDLEADNIPIDVKPLTLSDNAIEEDDSIDLTVEFVNIDTLDSHDVVIDWGDGTATMFTLSAGLREFVRSHQYVDDDPSNTSIDPYTITVTITDEDNDEGSAASVILVSNVQPTVSLSSVADISENGVATLNGSFFDAGRYDEHDLIVDWDDPNYGTNSTFAIDPTVSLSVNDTFNSSTDSAVLTITSVSGGTVGFTVQHQYLDDGVAPGNGTAEDTSSITVTVSDDDLGDGADTTDVLVQNVDPVITLTTNSASSETKAEEDEPVTISGNFTDVGTLDLHTVSIDWGDGFVSNPTVVQGAGFGSFSDSHPYAVGGIYTVTITVMDDDLGMVTAKETVFITGVGIQEIDGKKILFVVGSDDDDQVSFHKQGKNSITVHADFLSDKGHKRTLSAEGLDSITVFLCAGDDHATIAGNVDIPAIMDGGAGDDHLVGGGVGSVLIGGPGDDMLIGTIGRDILIGGDGRDRLVGQGGEDILIGGSTSFTSGDDDDLLANNAALLSILAEWNSDRDLETRMSNIDGSGAGPDFDARDNADNYFQWGVTVTDDGDEDVLTGSAGTDWFFEFPDDILTDFLAKKDKNTSA